jgi:hypothetical protein
MRLQLTPETEQVELKAGTDFGTEGLVLKHDPGQPPEKHNSPANLVIDGGDMTIDLTGSAERSPLITVGKGVTLTLRNITLMGLASKQNDPSANLVKGNDEHNNNAPLIKVEAGGKLIMEEGALLKDNYNQGGPGGVQVEGGGEFTMDGGEISNVGGDKGGGVAVNGIFIMNRGTISDNTVSGDGGGVYLNQNGEMHMSGGIISGNKAGEHGGGVVLQAGNNVFTMSGGTISGNKAEESGGGVYIVNGTCVMNYGGTISNNVTGQKGGGVYMKGGAFSIIYGGSISGNRVSSRDGQGGGVYVGGGGVFSMSLGSISGNGIYPGNPGGSYGNGLGCGVYVDEHSTFRKTGGVIYGLVDEEEPSPWEPRWEEASFQNYYRFQVTRDSSSATTVPYNKNNPSVPGGKGAGYAVYYAGGDPDTTPNDGPWWRDMTAGQTCSLDTNHSAGWGDDTDNDDNYP